MKIVVFDTNIWISAQLSLNGAPFRCVSAAQQGLVRSVTCLEILAEIQAVLRDKFLYTPALTQQVVQDIQLFTSLVTISNTLHNVVTDDADHKVIECAIVAKADYLVTGDKRHLLPLRAYGGVTIVSAADFLVTLPDLQ